VALLLFMAVMGKSAQFPLHVWLPDAMEGPTPVSALLHAATMVAAGVYLVVRSYPLFMHAPLALDVMAHLGAFTALFAAIVAFVQTDIKKVLAYSTCSQLGYMVAALGAGSLMGGYFHLTTHAAFKALLFLAAGSVIHAVHSNEMSDMGGLYKKMPVTTLVFIVGSAALAGIPPFAGFFSKDLILEAMEHRHLTAPLVALMAGAFLTAAYMTRVIALTFFGKPSKKASHAHESGASMLLPLCVLAVLALGAGFFAPNFAKLYGVEHESFHMTPVGWAALALAVSGAGLSWLVFGKRSIPESSFAFLAPVGAVARSAAVDRMYVWLFQRVGLVLANSVGWFDRYVVDGLMNFAGWLAIKGGQRLRRTQTGNVQDYVYAVVAGAVLVVAWATVALGRGVLQ
jgi:NADH-quinone oxidoreductase subunit L